MWLEGDSCSPTGCTGTCLWFQQVASQGLQLPSRAGSGWVMSYLQGQLEVGKRGRYTCMCVLFHVDMAELECLSLGES